MKRLLAVFSLTVPEQRAVIALLSLFVAVVAVKNYRAEQTPPPPAPEQIQPSPSPGMRP